MYFRCPSCDCALDEDLHVCGNRYCRLYVDPTPIASAVDAAALVMAFPDCTAPWTMERTKPYAERWMACEMACDRAGLTRGVVAAMRILRALAI